MKYPLTRSGRQHESPAAGPRSTARFPVHGWAGLALVVVFWSVNWFTPGLRTHWAFFPLWLGFALAVDGLVYLRKGSSLLARSPRAYVGLFLVSAPIWWIFEALNARTLNWSYDGAQYFTWWQFFLLSSLSFTTVVPAVFGAAELVSTFGWVRRLGLGPRIAPTRGALLFFFIAGWTALALLLAWPRYFFWLIWGIPYLIVEPVNHRLGARTILDYTNRRNWRPVVALCVGVLICAFFWEFWNYLSYPKWIYFVPWVGFLHVFEMPLLGYLGYLPFALELFTLYHLAERIFVPHHRREYVQLLDQPEV